MENKVRVESNNGIRKVGRIEVTLDLIKELLKIPKNHKILYTFTDTRPENYTGNLIVVLEGPDMPESGEGEIIPKIEVEYDSIKDKLTFKGVI